MPLDEVFDFIGTYISEAGYPPTVREIGEAFRVGPSTAQHWLSALVAAGRLERDENVSRGLRLVTQG
jgi:repressor LexA